MGGAQELLVLPYWGMARQSGLDRPLKPFRTAVPFKG